MSGTDITSSYLNPYCKSSRRIVGLWFSTGRYSEDMSLNGIEFAHFTYKDHNMQFKLYFFSSIKPIRSAFSDICMTHYVNCQINFTVKHFLTLITLLWIHQSITLTIIAFSKVINKSHTVWTWQTAVVTINWHLKNNSGIAVQQCIVVAYLKLS